MNQKIYSIALTCIIILAAVLRFWNLGELQELVFDEVYFPKYGHNYLNGEYFFDVHPPLGKYIIGVGIWLHNHMPWVSDPAYDAASIEQLSAWGWRWLNALTGTALCFVIARLSMVLYPSRLLSLILAAFIATDGMLVVESRYGLLNIYLVFFGTCALYFIAKAFAQPKMHRRNMILCGIFLALSLSVKWNGLGYSLIVWSLTIMPAALFFLSQYSKDNDLSIDQHERAVYFGSVKFWEYGLYFLVFPALIYFLIWQPHLSMFDQYGFVGMQKQIMGFHSNSVGANVHPYCSSWHTWPLMLRPVGYYFNSDKTSPDPADHTYTDVHLLGNPILFWFSALAILVLTVIYVLDLLRWFRSGKIQKDMLFKSVVVIGFYANWFPWSVVTRCLFQYHYMAASVFSFMALGWYLNHAILSRYIALKVLGGIVACLLLFGFIFWLPLQLGIPLHPDSFYDRILFQSWI